MQERKTLSAENALTGAVLLAAGGVAAAEIFLGLPHYEAVDLPIMIAIANTQGIPATPMLNVIKEKTKQLLKLHRS